jgi:hypothetical protein
VSGSRRFVEELARDHLAEARAAAIEAGVGVDLLAWVPAGAVPPLVGDGVAA